MENYFNYFTEIEEHFRTVGKATLLSPLDWSLIEPSSKRAFRSKLCCAV
jgi:hypothetical protein